MIEFIWEDSLLEKKLESDLKDLLKTLVAFSNTVRPGHSAIILIGEKDDGIVQGVTNPDNIQKKIRQEAEKIYPPILWKSSVYKKNELDCVRIEIEYSGSTPHFGGPAWIRKGSETILASDNVFQTLIDIRLGIVNELYKWLTKEVTIHGDPSSVPPRREGGKGVFINPTRVFRHRWDWEEYANIVFVNSFWVTFEKLKDNSRISEPITGLTLSFDDNKQQLKIIIDY